MRVICKRKSGHLTVGKIYESDTSDETFISVISDDKSLCWCSILEINNQFLLFSDYFTPIEDIREEKLNKLGI